MENVTLNPISSLGLVIDMTMPVANQKKMKDQGFSDVCDGKEIPRFGNKYYMEGWNEAKAMS